MAVVKQVLLAVQEDMDRQRDGIIGTFGIAICAATQNIRYVLMSI